ncbi:SGNH/GDSL hydrolase family protein [Kibdelosporangium phytohabitans]|uniref:SGNH hydrolase n=1 Tax=Kibdelosporangium phytohabitans TaxID=860235 RepID=A0A0N9IGB5_9PSEU|nr:SGNH/GDSL hydrolase family protein [Kibdelosporangium phytohabitans]ALG14381.1 SGNH hydrolase [Kibdelosporangium phytohabitans]MBE1466583.1 lysophospholipase L1-like esterase [Kibdelosporangium phytohabitans]
MRRLLAAGMVAAATIGLVATSSGAQTPGGWIGTWAASPATGVANTDDGYPNFSIRNVVHTSVGGGVVRVRLSNAFGAKPLQFGQVTVAVAAEPNSPRAVPGSVRTLKFGGSQTVTVPPGAEVLTDPAVLRVPEDSDLLVTTYVPTPSGPVTYHPAALQTSFFNRTGNFTTDESGTPYNEQTHVWHYVSGVDVQGSPASASVVTLGDSITDGVGSTAGTNRRWPDVLADRLKTSQRRLGVLNAGISGNRLLLDGGGFGRNALARLDEDVLSLGGVRTLIVLEGINDIQQTPHQTDPAQLIAAYRQILAQAKARGIRVVGGTITPFKGWGVWTETLEATRQAVNTFIRAGGAFDGVVDFDAAVRDPRDPLRIKPEYDTGDHLHPNDAGLRAMGEAVPLGLL